MCVSPLCKGSDSETEHEETSSSLGFSSAPTPTVSNKSEPESVEVHGSPVEIGSRGHVVVVFETNLVPIVEVEMAQLPPSSDPSCKALDAIPEEGASCPGVSEESGRIVGSSPASYFWSDGPQVTRCFQVASWLPRGDADLFSARPLAVTLLCSTVPN